jgi:hypothetical protein
MMKAVIIALLIFNITNAVANAKTVPGCLQQASATFLL